MLRWNQEKPNGKMSKRIANKGKESKMEVWREKLERKRIKGRKKRRNGERELMEEGWERGCHTAVWKEGKEDR